MAKCTMHVRARITRARPAGDAHQVLSVKGGGRSYRRQPCSDCPWRKDAVGIFPAEAFKHSAGTAADGSMVDWVGEDAAGSLHGFACHQSGPDKPATCAGYILRATNAISWRIGASAGSFDPAKVSDGGVPLWDGYREMAEANGVASDDPALASVFAADENWEARIARLKRERRKAMGRKATE